MSQQQKLWVALVKERLYNLGWSQTQLAEKVLEIESEEN